jgi:lipopolysaccharide cholinephosphotransferase
MPSRSRSKNRSTRRSPQKSKVKDDANEHFTDPKFIKFLYQAHLDIHNLFVKNNIAYYSAGGTTLGAIRHNGIINFDNDVDLEVSVRDVPRLMAKDFKAQLKKAGYYIKYHREKGSDDSFDWVKILSKKKVTGHRADIDLFTVYFDRDEDGRMRTYYSSEYVQEIWPKAYLYLSELLPLKQVKFGDGYMIVPNKAKKYLTRAYGASWSKKAIITQDPNTHYDLDEPITLEMKKFLPAKEFYPAKNQIQLERKDILMTLCGYGFLD